MKAEEIIVSGILRDVSELPDRTSPEDTPDHVIVSMAELEEIVRTHTQALREAGLLIEPEKSILVSHDEETGEWEIERDWSDVKHTVECWMDAESHDEGLHLSIYRATLISQSQVAEVRRSEYCPLCNDGNTLEEVLEAGDCDECPLCDGAGRVYADDMETPWRHLEDEEWRYEMVPSLHSIIKASEETSNE